MVRIASKEVAMKFKLTGIYVNELRHRRER
jgi:hypothetical protein